MNAAAFADQARRAYQTSAVQADDSLGLVVQLYDGMLAFLRRGAAMLRSKDVSGAVHPIRRATDIVGELQAVLDLEQGREVAYNLDRIYSYCRRKIMEAHLKGDPDTLDEVADLLAPLRDAWAEARTKQLTGAAR